MRQDDEQIVISGIGPITPIGIGAPAIHSGLRQGVDGLRQHEAKLGEQLWDCSFMHTVDDFDIHQFGIDQRALDYIHNWKEGDDNRDVHFMLAALQLACRDAQLDDDPDQKRALVAAHENPGLEPCLLKTYHQAFAVAHNKEVTSKVDFYQTLFQQTLKSGYEAQSFMTLFHLARTFDVHNYSLLINNACASGLYALEAAADLIRLGKAEQVLVVAADCPDVFKRIWLKNIKMYQPDGRIKPFACDGQGFVLGEGAVAMVLETERSAAKRGARIYADYLGAAFRLEGWGVTTPMIGGGHYQAAMTDALTQAQLSAVDIDVLCAHGVGTLASDEYEARAIVDVFGESQVPVTALKPRLGHNLGGSNLLELALLLLSLDDGRVPAIGNTSLESARTDLDLILTERPLSGPLIMKTCAAFAGFNAATILRWRSS